MKSSKHFSEINTRRFILTTHIRLFSMSLHIVFKDTPNRFAVSFTESSWVNLFFLI